MHPTWLTASLSGRFDPSAVFAGVLADRDDVFWLDSGSSGVSYLGSGTRRDVTDVWGSLRAVPGGHDLGAVGWLGYELRGSTTGATVTQEFRYPDAAFLTVDRVIAIDGTTGRCELVARGEGWTADLVAWRERVAELSGAAAPAARPVAGGRIARWRESDDEYLRSIAACQAAIREGEAYQLCLTTEAAVAGEFDPLDVYLRLRAASPTHHGGLIRIGGVSLLSASPEQFLAISPHGEVTTRPIKGTRPRAGDRDRDAALARELRESAKEQAENLMIVDLMRNDLARVCELGSVTVTELLEVESYAQVHQLVSTVTGQLESGRSPIDAIEACFPAGSMTGAPKRRATELLDGIERRARGLYAGAFGYVAADGRVDLAMTIRSIVLDAGGATVGAGGGITALSVAVEELAEVRLKAGALLAALGAESPRPAP